MPSHYDQEVANRHGVDIAMPLDRRCADFYLLERMVADGYRAAQRELGALERELVRSFTTYVDLAVGGEIRHLGRMVGGDTPPEPEEPDCEEENCCSCQEEYEEELAYWQENQLSVSAQLLDSDVPESMVEYFEECENSNTRSFAWEKWAMMRKDQGLSLLEDAHYTLQLPIWDAGFGGKGWATATGILYSFLREEMKPRTFIDRCWTLQHNNGSLFNKVWGSTTIARLWEVLETQKNDEYERLLRHASPNVKGLWRHRHNQRMYSRLMQHDPVWLGVQYILDEGGENDE